MAKKTTSTAAPASATPSASAIAASMAAALGQAPASATPAAPVALPSATPAVPVAVGTPAVPAGYKLVPIAPAAHKVPGVQAGAVTRYTHAAYTIAALGLKAGVTVPAQEYIGNAYGNRNEVEDAIALRNAWHCISAYLRACGLEAPAAMPNGLGACPPSGRGPLIQPAGKAAVDKAWTSVDTSTEDTPAK